MVSNKKNKSDEQLIPDVISPASSDSSASLGDTKKPSIKDIARIAGVSVATVSHVLNDKGRFSPETAQRVRAVAEAQGYQLNMAARALRAARTETVGLIIPNMMDEFFAEIAYYTEKTLYEQGYSVMICNTDNREDKETGYYRLLAGKQVDGILSVSRRSGSYQDLEELNIPTVLVDSPLPADCSAPVVASDETDAMAQAVDCLLSGGSQNILLLAGYLPAGMDPYQAGRAASFARCLEERGMRFDKNYCLIREGKADATTEIRQLLTDFLAKGFPVDGIIASSENAALGAIAALSDAGLSVPKDVQIITFNNTMLSSLITPPLSSIERFPRNILVDL